MKFNTFSENVQEMWDCFYNELSIAEKECTPQKIIVEGKYKKKVNVPLDRKIIGKVK